MQFIFGLTCGNFKKTLYWGSNVQCLRRQWNDFHDLQNLGLTQEKENPASMNLSIHIHMHLCLNIN